ncbi:MAG: TIGR03905 family TSCPD domain-containing protein [Clostridia bacterium]|nr:TIGR03905 family TSCPD domain-containing protein [Clostridia bacterium]
MHTYKTLGTCSRQILFDFENDVVKNVKFIGGCSGNLQGIAKLVENNSVDNVIKLLKGIQCRNGTSCPDQLSKALEDYKLRNKQ